MNLPGAVELLKNLEKNIEGVINWPKGTTISVDNLENLREIIAFLSKADSTESTKAKLRFEGYVVQMAVGRTVTNLSREFIVKQLEALGVKNPDQTDDERVEALIEKQQTSDKGMRLFALEEENKHLRETIRVNLQMRDVAIAQIGDLEKRNKDLNEQLIVTQKRIASLETACNKYKTNSEAFSELSHIFSKLEKT